MKRIIILLILLMFNSGCACQKEVAWKSELDSDAPVVRIHTIKTRLSRAYLIEMPKRMIVVDPGPCGSEKRIIKQMKEIGRSDLKLIYITHAHFDHYGSAEALKKLTGAAIAIHKADVKALEQGETLLGHVKSWGRLSYCMLPILKHLWPTSKTKADLVFEDGHKFDGFGIKAVAVHIPGHTPGSSALFIDDRYLFVGDLILSTPRSRIQRHTADNWTEIEKSLQRIKGLQPVLIFPGHGRKLSLEEVNKLKVK